MLLLGIAARRCSRILRERYGERTLVILMQCRTSKSMVVTVCVSELDFDGPVASGLIGY